MTSVPTDLVAKHCPTCFIHYAAPQAMFSMKNETSECWYCPNGHQIIYSASKLAKAEREAAELRKERDLLKQNEAWWSDRLDAERKTLETERKATAALKRQMKKVHTRVGNGVCPCCNRSFANLQRHMAGKHPEFEKAA